MPPAMTKRCKRVGSFEACLEYDPGNEMYSIALRRPGTLATPSEGYRLWFSESAAARSWFRHLRGITDVEDLLRVSARDPDVACERFG